MKLNKKSIRIAYWAVRIMAITFALLLFSITGIIATLTATHANGLISALNQDTTTTPTDILTATANTTPTQGITPTPTATLQPTVILRRTPTVAPNPTKAATPPRTINATATSVVVSPLNATPTTTKTTPTATPSNASTPNTHDSQTPTIPGDISTHHTPPATPNTKTTTTTSLIWPIIGISAIVALFSAGLLTLAIRKKGIFASLPAHGATTPAQSSPVQNPAPWMNGQAVETSYNNSHALPTEAASIPSMVQQAIFPFIPQSSPLPGITPSAQLDTPASSTSNTFQPLLFNYPAVSESPSKQALAMMTPATDTISTQPTLPAVSTQSSPISGPVEAASKLSHMQTPIPLSLQIAPPAYQFPLQDPFLESLMHQAQMGLFALPGKGKHPA